MVYGFTVRNIYFFDAYMKMQEFYVYWIQSKSRNMTYIGATVDPRKRLRQHNLEIAGGARRTFKKGPWYYYCVISGFREWKECLQYEFMLKLYMKRCKSMESKVNALKRLNAKERWSSNSPLASEVPLVTEFYPQQFGSPPVTYDEICKSAALKPAARKRTNTSWKKCVCGIKY